MTDLRMEDQVTIAHCKSCDTTYVDTCACKPIDVLVESNGEVVWRAEVNNEEEALYAARIGWDEAWNGLQGQKRAVIFMVGEKAVLRTERRP